MKKTREEARARFAELGMEKYGDLYEADIQILYMMLNRRLKQWVKEPGCTLPTMHLSKRVKVDKRTNGMVRSAFLFVNSFYFTQREAVSFNGDGFIGFAGWADDGNVQPILDAFIEWCDYMEGCKDG